MVGTAKQTLKVTLNGRYGEDEIRTFVVEAEAIVNSRPLARVTSNASEPLPVTLCYCSPAASGGHAREDEQHQ